MADLYAMRPTMPQQDVFFVPHKESPWTAPYQVLRVTLRGTTPHGHNCADIWTHETERTSDRSVLTIQGVTLFHCDPRTGAPTREQYLQFSEPLKIKLVTTRRRHTLFGAGWQVPPEGRSQIDMAIRLAKEAYERQLLGISLPVQEATAVEAPNLPFPAKPRELT